MRGRSGTRWMGCDLIAADAPLSILRKASLSSSTASENYHKNPQETRPNPAAPEQAEPDENIC